MSKKDCKKHQEKKEKDTFVGGPAAWVAVMGSVEQSENEHGLTLVRLTHESGATAVVHSFGATVLSFTTAGGQDLIFCSSTALLDGSKAIRGGIPLVFPQFGQPDKRLAQHGFARNSVWQVLPEPSSVPDEFAGMCTCVLGLDNTIATHEAWPYPYRIEYFIAIGPETIVTKLMVHNSGEENFAFQSLLHTYIAIGDISATTISGLQGQSFFDKASDDPDTAKEDPDQHIEVAQYVDRIYVPPPEGLLPDPVTIVSPVGSISLSRHAQLSNSEGTKPLPADTVVWNPWAEKAAALSDLEEGGYMRMVCVEPGLVNGTIQLEPGACAALTQRISLER